MHNTISIKIIYWSLQNVSHRKPPCPRTSTQATSRDECSGESTSLTADLEQPAYVGQPDTSTSFTTPMKTSTPFTTPMKTNRDDHSYSITESPRSVKRKCIIMQDAVTSLQKRLKTSQTKSRRLRTKVASLQTVVKTLKEKHMLKHMLSDQGIEMLEKTCDVPSELMKRLVKARHTDKTCKEKYPPALRAFTLTLNFYSAKAYRFVRKTFDLQLPHPSVIRKWYSSIDGQPGFTAEAFNTLEMKAREATPSNGSTLKN